MPWRDCKEAELGGSKIAGTVRMRTVLDPKRGIEIVVKAELPPGVVPAGPGAEIALDGVHARIVGIEKVGDRYSVALSNTEDMAFPERPIPAEQPANPKPGEEIVPHEEKDNDGHSIEG